MGAQAPPGAPTLRFDTPNQRDEYASSLRVIDDLNMPYSGRFVRTVLSQSRLALRTENGYPAWDMKPMLLGGPKARISKKGKRYNIIPFRHGAPGSTRFKAMPADIHSQAKALTASLMVGNRLIAGGRLQGTEVGHPPMAKRFTKITGEKGYYQHKSGKYEGMSKIESDGQSRYMTFRVVSDTSAGDSWYHPGRPAQPHLDFVRRYCTPKITKLIKAAAVRDMMDGSGVMVSIGAE